MIPTSTERPAQDLARLHDDYVRKLDSALTQDRPALAAELSAGYESEAGLRSTVKHDSSALLRRSRSLLRRLDRHTLQTFNPGWPYQPLRPRDPR